MTRVTPTPLEVPNAFRKSYRKKTPEMRKSIDAALRQLQIDHTHDGLHTHRVQGSPGVYEARIDGANRITFHWNEDIIVLRKNCNHDILKRP